MSQITAQLLSHAGIHKNNSGETKASIEFSQKDIPQSARIDKQIIGEITAKKSNNTYTLTLKTGEKMDLKISPEIPVGTRFVAKLNAQGKPTSGELLPPNTPANTPKQPNPQAIAPQAPHKNTSPDPKASTDTPKQPAQNTNTHINLQKGEFVDVKQLENQRPLPKGEQVQLKAIQNAANNTVQKLSTNANIQVLVTNVVNNANSTSNANLILKGIALPEVPSSGNTTTPATKGQAIEISLPKASVPLSKNTNTLLQTLTLKTNVDASGAKIIDAKPLQLNTPINVQSTPQTATPNIPKQALPLIQNVSVQSLKTFVETAQIQPSTALNKLPPQTQLVTQVISTSVQPQTNTQNVPQFTQTLALPSGETINVKTPQPLPHGTIVKLQTPAQQTVQAPANTPRPQAPQITQAVTPTIQHTTIQAPKELAQANISAPLNHNNSIKTFDLPANFTATVTSRVDTQTASITLPNGRSTQIQLPEPLPVGTHIKITTTPNGTLNISAVQLPIESANPAAIVQKFNGQWEALQTALKEIRNVQGDAKSDLAKNIPELQRNMLASLPFFAQAVMDETAEKWLGQDTLNVLKAMGVDLSADISQLSQLSNKTDTPDGWRALFFPYQGDQENLKQGGFYWKNDKDSVNKNNHVRFIVESEMSQLGVFQIDGLLNQKHLNIKIRTTKDWDAEIINGLNFVVEQTLDKLDFTGSLHVETNKTFEKAHLIAIINSKKNINLSV